MKVKVYTLVRTSYRETPGVVFDYSFERIHDIMAEAYADAVNSLSVEEYDSDNSCLQEEYARLVVDGVWYEWHILESEIEIDEIAACMVVKDEKVANVCVGTVKEMMLQADISAKNYGTEKGVSQILVVKHSSDGKNEIMFERLPEDFRKVEG